MQAKEKLKSREILTPQIGGTLMLSIGAYSSFGYALALSLVATWVTGKLSRRFGIVNNPNPIVPQHTSPVAYLGGLGIVVGAGGTLALRGILQAYGIWADSNLPSVPWSVFVGGTLFLILGTIDDLKPLTAVPKVTFMALAGAVAVLLGLVYPLTGLWALDAFLSCVWIFAMVNALNFTDVCDGLVGGLSVVMLLFFAHFGTVDPSFTMALAGACLGFLAFNAPPARIFLGDAGSLPLGFLLGAFAIMTRSGESSWPHLAVVGLALGVPLFELVFITVVRIQKGLPWWRGSPDHFSLRLQAIGLTRWQTDLIAWSVAILLCAGAWGVSVSTLPGQIVVLAAAFVLLGLCWRLLLRWEVERRVVASVLPTTEICVSVESAPEHETAPDLRMPQMPDI